MQAVAAGPGPAVKAAETTLRLAAAAPAAAGASLEEKVAASVIVVPLQATAYLEEGIALQAGYAVA
jgi:hypothetical protein